MTIARNIQQGSIALMAVCSMGTIAAAGQQLGGAVQGNGGGLGIDLAEVSGSALGTILMPTTTELGILVAVGQAADHRVFMLDAELTAAIPGLFDPQTRVAFGGVYGRLFEAPWGSGSGAAAFDGVVEGMWRLDKSLIGSYEALVYERDAMNGLRLVGRIQGAFRVADSNAAAAAVPGPVLGVAPKPSKKRNALFDDVASGLVPYGDDVVWVREKKSAHPDLGDDNSSKGAQGSVGASAYGTAHPKSAGPAYSGATKLQFKLVD